MQNVIDFVMNHSVVMAAVLIAILDLIFALIPSVESNGILHSVYVFLKNLVTEKAQD